MQTSIVFFVKNGHGHSCDRVTICCLVCMVLVGIIIVLTGAIAYRKRDETAYFASFAYTQTIVRLYANDLSAIRKLKRIVEFIIS